MRIILVRHGQTEWNLQNRIQGWMDSPLTEKAIIDTQSMVIPDVENPIIYTSDLGRAVQSSQLLCERFDGRIVVDSRLRERCFGVLEGCVVDQDVELLFEWHEYEHRYVNKMVSVFGVEAEQELETRIMSFIETLRFQDKSSDVVIVSHGEWLRAFQNIIQHQPSWREGQGIVDNNSPIEIIWHELASRKEEICPQPKLPC